MSINLQNLDELHLTVGDKFWVEWFPCGRQEVFDRYVDAVTGVIAGRYRVVLRQLLGKTDSAVLERPDGRGGWERVATCGGPGCLVPGPRARKILQNTGARR